MILSLCSMMFMFMVCAFNHSGHVLAERILQYVHYCYVIDLFNSRPVKCEKHSIGNDTDNSMSSIRH